MERGDNLKEFTTEEILAHLKNDVETVDKKISRMYQELKEDISQEIPRPFPTFPTKKINL